MSEDPIGSAGPSRLRSQDPPPLAFDSGTFAPSIARRHLKLPNPTGRQERERPVPLSRLLSKELLRCHRRYTIRAFVNYIHVCVGYIQHVYIYFLYSYYIYMYIGIYIYVYVSLHMSFLLYRVICARMPTGFVCLCRALYRRGNEAEEVGREMVNKKEK